MRKDEVERYLWSPQMVWGRPDGVLTAAGAAECHMGRPIRPMKGEQRHPEALSPLVKMKAVLKKLITWLWQNTIIDTSTNWLLPDDV